MKKLDPDQIKELKVLYYEGMSTNRLSERFRVSVASVYNYLGKGPKRGRHKLNPRDVINILAEPENKSLRELGMKYGVSHEMIRKIRSEG